ncbi:hypothetical protein [Pedosphaera parvula]|uniref:Uncharacterized protein n=1 Tax=Pedosphaera parvula (strain Ellin514) TaxID=320771 RepID=B9XHT0_PEDPL|nr:hypothetical protein [Pedosphaera parvula]EEF60658.1 hypothetical protein Cflav_PD6249 [Pedosphaera parvula Ellin514]
MKVLIQNIKTGKYLAKNNKWVTSEAQAVDLCKLPVEVVRSIKGNEFRAVLYVAGEKGKPGFTFGAGNFLKSLCELKPLEAPDTHYLRAAQGWNELGNPVEACKELGQITPTQWAHPEVMEVRAKIGLSAGM